MSAVNSVLVVGGGLGSGIALRRRTDLYYGGPSFIAGYCPTGEDSLYAYIVEAARDRSTLTPDEQLTTMISLAELLTERPAVDQPLWDEFHALVSTPA
nr:hypothetical protein [Cryptosporangium phraense]